MLRTIVLGTLALCMLGAAVGADEVVLIATDSKSISPAGENWNDNRLRAYYSGRHVDGFVKFDFSSIPDDQVITSMVLTTYHEAGFGNPFDDPEVRIYRVADDSWSRGPTDPHPGLDEVLTPIHTGFPAGDLIPYDWDLDVDAADWSVDLLDDVLSLGMRNEKQEYSYVYWHGADANPAPPILTVNYIPEPATLGLLAVGLVAVMRRRR